MKTDIIIDRLEKKNKELETEIKSLNKTYKTELKNKEKEIKSLNEQLEAKQRTLDNWKDEISRLRLQLETANNMVYMIGLNRKEDIDYMFSLLREKINSIDSLDDSLVMIKEKDVDEFIGTTHEYFDKDVNEVDDTDYNYFEDQPEIECVTDDICKGLDNFGNMIFDPKNLIIKFHPVTGDTLGLMQTREIIAKLNNDIKTADLYQKTLDETEELRSYIMKNEDSYDEIAELYEICLDFMNKTYRRIFYKSY